MDGKTEIRLDSSQEELVNVAIGFTASCSLYMVLGKGLVEIQKDIKDMNFYIRAVGSKGPGFENMSDFERGKIIKSVEDQLKIANLALEQSKAFMTELGNVIKELEPKEQTKKVIIHKPSW